MGGVAKGLLKAPESETTLLERLLSELRIALPQASIVLVGDARAYAAFNVPTLDDDPPGVGPLGGVMALLEFAKQHAARSVLALTCDLPRIGRAVLARLAAEAPQAAALVTQQVGVRNPLIARYAVTAALPAARSALSAGSHSVQALLDRIVGEVSMLALSPEEEASLADWDVPEDVR
jgi:molybdopterin-guanine dinucleotide biosynthesis protein A